MTDHLPKYNSESILSYQWPTFFSTVLQKFQGQPIMVEQNGDLLLDEPFIAVAPLQDITYKKKKVTMTTGGSQGQTVTLDHLTLVWAVRNEKDQLVAVELISETDEKYVVRFSEA